MNTIKQVTSNIILTLLKNKATEEIAEAIALMEVEEAISKMCYEH